MKVMNEYSREWLNKDKGLACIEYDVVLHTYGKESYPSLDASFSIRDCTRQVTLEFYSDNEEDFSNILHKLAILKQAVSSFEAKLTEAIDKYKELYAQAESKRIEKESN